MNDKTQVFDPYTNTQVPAASGRTQGFASPVDPNRTVMAPPPVYQPTVLPGVTGVGEALSLSVEVGNRYALTTERTRQHVLTQLRIGAGMGVSGGRRMPVNVALVIDRSGSMEGEPLEYVKRACAHVVDLLNPDDVLSIVTFEETVDVIMPSRRVTDPNLIKQHLSRITAGNTTNLFDGLYAAGAQVASVPNLQSYVTRILLLTDGEPTAGLRDFQSIVNQVADLKARGITVTALGFGPEYNEELMAGIARRSGGNYHYIARPEEIPAVFRREMEQVMGVSARNVRLALHVPRNTQVRQVYGSPPSFGPRLAEINLGDLESGATVTKLWEMDWEPRRAGSWRVAKAVATYQNAQGQTATATANAIAEWTNDAAQVSRGANPLVAQELSVVLAARDMEKTMMGMRTQQLSSADITRALEKTQVLLTQQGRVTEAREIAQAAQAARAGDDSAIEKTLIGTIYHLDQGRR